MAVARGHKEEEKRCCAVLIGNNHCTILLDAAKDDGELKMDVLMRWVPRLETLPLVTGRGRCRPRFLAFVDEEGELRPDRFDNHLAGQVLWSQGFWFPPEHPLWGNVILVSPHDEGLTYHEADLLLQLCLWFATPEKDKEEEPPANQEGAY